MTESNYPQSKEYLLRPGYIYVPQSATMISTVLGSCVSVCLWDKKRGFGGVNHFLYPLTRDPARATARYGNVATKALIRIFLEEGSSLKHLEAQIFGGSALAESSPEAAQISRENIAIARHVLQRSKISIVSEDVGGNKGRKLVYNSYTNEVLVIRPENIRQSDWYPYEGSR